MDNIKKYQLIGFLLEYLNSNEKKNPKGKPYTESFLNKYKKDDLINFYNENVPKNDRIEDFSKYENTKQSFNFEKKLGLKKYTKKTLPPVEEWIKNEDDKYTNPFKGTENIIDKTKSLIELKEHQQKFLQGFLIGNLRCAIAFHGVGSGKTLTAVATARMYLNMYPNNKVIVITPPAVLYNFLESMVAYGVDPRDPRFKYFSYDKWAMSKGTAKDSLLIVDEAHNLRTQIIQQEKKDAQGRQYTSVEFGKKTNEILVRGGIPAHKVLLLTGTPFVNKPYDIENLLAIGEGRQPNDPDLFGRIVSNKNMRYDYFKYRISDYNVAHDSNFPKRNDHYIPIVVSRESEEGELIKAQGGKTNPFFILSRKATLDKEKLSYTFNIIKKNPTKKYVIYVSLTEYGVKPIEKLCDKLGIKYGLVSGKVSTGNKKEAITEYNENKIQLLIITRAGAEGVNLKETRGIFILDGQWNDSLYEQIVARAIRYKSHDNLPEKDRYVDVYKLFLCYPDEKMYLAEIKSGKFDFKKFLKKVQEIRAKRNKEKKSFKDEDDEDDVDFDEEELAKLKKGERHDYIEKNLQFGKNREFYQTQKVISGGEGLPSIDFYMFVLQYVKQMIIDKLIKQLHSIPTLEKSIYDLPIGKELFGEIEKRKLNGKQMMTAIINFLRPKINEVENLIALNNTKMITKNDKSKLQMYVEKKKELDALKTAKKKLHVGQEYFTPLHIAEELIKMSDIKQSEKNIRILEPTAGYGNIIQVLLNIMSKQRKNFDIDLIEFDEGNRKELQKYCDKIPDVLHLLKTHDFLEFVPSEKYDYIFMNPPFLLRKSQNTKYNTDIYDYDFVKRSYACLELHGQLVAITGQAWKKNKEIMKWYKEVNAEIVDDIVEWKGEGLKEGSEIKKLPISYIKINKLDDKDDEAILSIYFDDLDRDF